MQGLIDMHCHIVPGVDDGARDLYDAAKILQLEYRNQVQSVIVTPHYRAGMFETPQKEVERQFQRIDEMTRRSRSGMRVYLGCEYECSYGGGSEEGTTSHNGWNRVCFGGIFRTS